MSDQKRCSKCNVVKPYGDFQNSKAMKCGKYSQCRDCRNAEQRKNNDIVKSRLDVRLCQQFLGVASSNYSRGAYDV